MESLGSANASTWEFRRPFCSRFKLAVFKGAARRPKSARKSCHPIATVDFSDKYH
jgi:hypothetical protein